MTSPSPLTPATNPVKMAPMENTGGFIGAPEPELWRKVDGYSVGVYDWAIVTERDVHWFDDEDQAWDAFDAMVARPSA